MDPARFSGSAARRSLRSLISPTLIRAPGRSASRYAPLGSTQATGRSGRACWTRTANRSDVHDHARIDPAEVVGVDRIGWVAGAGFEPA